MVSFNIFKKKQPLSLDQIQKLAELEVNNKGFKIIPGKIKRNRVLYMVIWYKDQPVAEVFSKKVQELPVSKEANFKPEDYMKLENFLKKIRELF